MVALGSLSVMLAEEIPGNPSCFNTVYPHPFPLPFKGRGCSHFQLLTRPLFYTKLKAGKCLIHIGREGEPGTGMRDEL